jgi:hypothetical protein
MVRDDICRQLKSYKGRYMVFGQRLCWGFWNVDDMLWRMVVAVRACPLVIVKESRPSAW